jgi:exoribonuclease R
MPSPGLRLPTDPGVLAAGLAAIRQELGLPAQYPAEAVAEARSAPERGDDSPRVDATELPLVTVDPAGSRDLDQAVLVERAGSGYVVHYAIADPGIWIRPGGPLDEESRRRGQTLYAPDSRVPLYPDQLGEGAASLLPDVDRPAVLWRIELDAAGEPGEVDVRRATVRSRQMLTYAAAQVALNVGTAEESLVLLREVGRLRQALEADRGGVSLRLATQEVVRVGATYRLGYTAPLPVEGWNAQISLLTGMCAAQIMLAGKVGLLRTLPTPGADTVEVLRRTAGVLEVEWAAGQAYPEFIRGLDPRDPAHAALLSLSASLLRGAGYTAFDGDVPEHPEHSAVAACYAHVTAPLRRLADRFVNEVVLAVCAGDEVPGWVRESLPELPALMTASSRLQRDLEHRVIDYVEAVVMAGRIGETFRAVVVESDDDAAVLQLIEPAVRTRVKGAGWPLGEQVEVRLMEADPVARRVELVRA